MRHYRQLLGLRLAHEYYQQGWPRGATLQATPDTAAFLARHGVIVKQVGDELALVAEDAALPGLWSEREQAARPRWLRFQVRSLDSELTLCTDMSALPQRLAPHLAEPLQLKPVSSLAALVCLRRDPGLLAELAVPLVADIFQDEAAWRAATGPVYQARLAARSTVWKYLLVGEWPSPAMRLVDLRGEVQFSEPAAETLPGGSTAWVIRSLSAIRLQERAGQRFQLRAGPNSSGRVLIGRMPVAAPAGLRYESVQDVRTAVSEIFINR